MKRVRERSTGRDEIAVTPGMVKAGLDAYRGEGSLIEDADNNGTARIFSAIFRAMFDEYQERFE
jgi:hypothetical protein